MRTRTLFTAVDKFDGIRWRSALTSPHHAAVMMDQMTLCANQSSFITLLFWWNQMTLCANQSSSRCCFEQSHKSGIRFSDKLFNSLLVRILEYFKILSLGSLIIGVLSLLQFRYNNLLFCPVFCTFISAYDFYL